MRTLLFISLVLVNMHAGADLVPDTCGGTAPQVLKSSPWFYVGDTSSEDRTTCETFSDCSGVLMVCFNDRSQLGAYVYPLAIHAGDVRSEMPLEKFVKGVSGCHYSVEQVAAWASVKAPDKSADPFLDILITNGFLTHPGRWYWPGGKFRHLVMVSKGKHRTLEQNIVHELFHVRYDQDAMFRSGIKRAWKSLSETQRTEFLNHTSSYDQSKEAQMIEEWGVRRAEDNWFQSNHPKGTCNPLSN